MAAALALRSHFDDDHLALFGVSIDPADEKQARVRASMPGVRHFWDFDGRVSRLYGALPQGEEAPRIDVYRPQWVLLNPNLQVRRVLSFAADGEDLRALPALLKDLPPIERFAGMEMHAPVILLPDIFEPSFCRTLIDVYERRGGKSTGFMQEIDGKTKGFTTPATRCGVTFSSTTRHCAGRSSTASVTR